MKKARKTVLTAVRVLGFVVLAGLLLTGCPDINNGGGSDESPVLIWQAYAGDGRGNGVSHNFVELYNPSEKNISLTGYYLWYSGAHKFFNEDEDNKVDDQEIDTPWEKIALSGTIPAKSSYLIRGEKANGTGSNFSDWWRIDLQDDDEVDMDLPAFWLQNRGFKIVLIEGDFQLTDAIQNPFRYNGKKVPGYVDMVGGINDPAPGGDDRIYGYEGPVMDYTDLDNLQYARCSAQEALRRKSLTDTDNNYNDFQSMRYTTKHFKEDGTVNHVNGVEDSECEGYKPKSSKYGAWNPIITRATEPDPPPPPPPPPPPGEETVAGASDELAGKLLILQASCVAHNDGPTHQFVELYNTTDAAITLTGYTLQYALATDTGGGWNVVTLTGSIPAKSSYLILGTKNSASATRRITIPDGAGDVNQSDLVLNNNGFKVVIIKGDKKLTVANPFNMNEDGDTAAGYVDMVGAANDGVTPTGYEGAAGETTFVRVSNQQGARRTSGTDTDVNKDDFTSVRYTVPKGTSGNDLFGINADELYHYTPKNTEYGTWDPFGTPTAITEDPYDAGITYTATQTGGTQSTTTTTGIEFTFNDAITSLNVGIGDITVSGTAEKGSATFTNTSGNTWLLSPITVNSQGNATVSIAKEGIDPAVKTVAVYKEISTNADYTKLILTEVSGNGKYVEIYNSDTVAISLEGVKLQRNDGPTGGSEWAGTAADSIPAGAYRLFLFNSFTTGLDTNEAYVGWTVSSGISSGQILKVAIVDPTDTEVSVFIRGDVPLPAWGNSTSITQDTTNSYSRMDDGTWAYAAPTPGAENGAKVDEIVSPGYLTAQP